MKRGIIVGTALVGIAGGFLIAQNTLFGSAEAAISAAEAKKIALEAYDGKVVEFEYDRDDAVPHYDFEIKNGNEKAEIVVDAITGDVTMHEVETERTTAVDKIEDTADVVKADAQIALNDATNKVTGEAPKTAETAKEQATQAAPVAQPAQPAAKVETAPKQQATQQVKQISKSEAINIAYTVGAGTVVKAELDSDDGYLTYEIELRDGNREYDIDIDAHTGKVLSVDSDFENDDRNDYDDDRDDNDDDDDDRYDD